MKNTPKAKMKTVTIDCRKWRCGDFSDEKTCKLGNGETELLNDNGRMCCLGFASLQLSPKLKKIDILYKGRPCDVGLAIPHLTDGYENSRLSQQAMEINDDSGMLVKDKIKKLTSLFKKYRINLIFKNIPKFAQL